MKGFKRTAEARRARSFVFHNPQTSASSAPPRWLEDLIWS
jgi:hypothetical protein